MALVLVLADTHLRAGQHGRLAPVIWETAETADLIVHAGDVVERDVLDELSRCAPVHAVLGNNDRSLRGELPDRWTVDVEGVDVAIVHDSGPRKGREDRMQRWFPDADVVVFGHSHEPVNTISEHGQLLFNPGSPTQRRRQPRCTFGVLEIDDGAVVRADVVPLEQHAVVSR